MLQQLHKTMFLLIST